jgi:hypothetical protein
MNTDLNHRDSLSQAGQEAHRKEKTTNEHEGAGAGISNREIHEIREREILTTERMFLAKIWRQ